MKQEKLAKGEYIYYEVRRWAEQESEKAEAEYGKAAADLRKMNYHALSYATDIMERLIRWKARKVKLAGIKAVTPRTNLGAYLSDIMELAPRSPEKSDSLLVQAELQIRYEAAIETIREAGEQAAIAALKYDQLKEATHDEVHVS